MIKRVRKFRNQYDLSDSLLFGLSCLDKSRTVQSEKDMFNPTFIMQRYRRDRDVSVFHRRKAIYADVSGMSGLSSFSDVMKRMDGINDLFMTLPASDREKFSNNAMKFLDFAADPANLNWLAEKGFIEPFEAVSNLVVSPKDPQGESSEVDS